MKYLLRLLLVVLSVTAKAEVFKCTEASGKTIYQANACQASVKEKQLGIKADPKTEIEAKAKLAKLQSQLEADKSAQLQAEKEASIQRYRAEELDALKRSAIAQQQQALATQRQADALEKQNQSYSNSVIFLPNITTVMPTTPIAPSTIRGPEVNTNKIEAKDKDANKNKLNLNSSCYFGRECDYSK